MSNMVDPIKIALSVAIVAGTALPASAASKHHGVSARRPAIYDRVRDSPGGGCSPTGVPLCSNICSGSGPCAPPDSW
jgi:hypothetical protein